MERLPAIAGWHWIKQGFALFRRQPGELSTLFVLYCCLNLSLNLFFNLVPIVGPILWTILVPVFSIAFLFACNDIGHDKRVHPKVLFAGIRSPAVKRLLGLGGCYFAVMFIAAFVTNIFDDGYLLQTLNTQASSPPASVGNTTGDLRLAKSFLFLMATYLFATIPFWFASPLIAWQNMSVGKAIFFSFFSVIRAFKALTLYTIGWFAIAIFVNVGISVALQALGVQNLVIELFLRMPFLFLLTVVMYCSYYASYIHIFGTPSDPEAPKIQTE